ncbi:hypothetical protein [Mucilaginibacter sp.]|nr:hypothetical protein [Mucilaginibacter sp.]
MPSPLKAVPIAGYSAQKKGQTTREKVENTLTSELVISICAPIGSM